MAKSDRTSGTWGWSLHGRRGRLGRVAGQGAGVVCRETTAHQEQWSGTSSRRRERCWPREIKGVYSLQPGVGQWLWLSPIQWTWIWANSRRWWRAGEPGMLQSMGSQSWTWLSNWRTTTTGFQRHDKPWWLGAQGLCFLCRLTHLRKRGCPSPGEKNKVRPEKTSCWFRLWGKEGPGSFWLLLPHSSLGFPFALCKTLGAWPALQPHVENSSVGQIRFIQRSEGTTASQFSLQQHSMRCGLHTNRRLEMSAHVGTGTSNSSGPALQSWAWIPFPLISFLFPLSYFLSWLLVVFPFHPADMWGHSLPKPTLPHIWKSRVHIWTPSSSGRSLFDILFFETQSV